MMTCLRLSSSKSVQEGQAWPMPWWVKFGLKRWGPSTKLDNGSRLSSDHHLEARSEEASRRRTHRRSSTSSVFSRSVSFLLPSAHRSFSICLAVCWAWTGCWSFLVLGALSSKCCLPPRHTTWHRPIAFGRREASPRSCSKATNKHTPHTPPPPSGPPSFFDRYAPVPWKGICAPARRSTWRLLHAATTHHHHTRP